MFDGRIRTITAVKHVFDLQMNLISQMSLDTNGFRYPVQGEIYESWRGLNSPKERNLLSLQVKWSPPLLMMDRVVDMVKLWNMYLGHASEEA